VSQDLVFISIKMREGGDFHSSVVKLFDLQ
jgi:hypothetical protein